MELVGRTCFVGDFGHIVVKSHRVEEGQGHRVVLIVELGEEVISPQPKLPMGPAPTCVGGIVHPRVAGMVAAVGGGGSGRGSAVGMRSESGEGVERKSEPILRTGNWESLLESKVSLASALEAI